MQILHTELMCSVGPSWIGWRPQPLLPVKVLYNISYANNAAVPGETGKSETSSPVHTRYMSHDNVGKGTFGPTVWPGNLQPKSVLFEVCFLRQSNPLPPIKHGESRGSHAKAPTIHLKQLNPHIEWGSLGRGSHWKMTKECIDSCRLCLWLGEAPKRQTAHFPEKSTQLTQLTLKSFAIGCNIL